MTFKDKSSFSRHHVLSLVSWARANPDYAIVMYDDKDLQDYLMTYLKGAAQLYQALKTPVERSDLWRYVVMCTHGGIYTDADTLCIRPVQVGGWEGVEVGCEGCLMCKICVYGQFSWVGGGRLKGFGAWPMQLEGADLWCYVVMCTHGGVLHGRRQAVHTASAGGWGNQRGWDSGCGGRTADGRLDGLGGEVLGVPSIPITQHTLSPQHIPTAQPPQPTSQEWNRENGHDAEVFFGVEDVFRRDPAGGDAGWGINQGRFGVQFEQWTLASAPGHPVYCDMARLIR